MRRIKELLMVNDKAVSIAMFIMITVFIPVISGRNLLKGATPCLYDFYINMSMYVVASVLVYFVLFYILYVERHNLSAMVVIRYKNKYSIWNKCVSDLFIMCILFTLYVYIVTTVSGLLITHKVCNWDVETSKCYEMTRQLCEVTPSFLLISFTFILQTFSTFFIMGLFMMLVWWLSDKKWLGYMTAIIIMLIEVNDGFDQISTGVLWRKSVITYSLYRKGIIPQKHILLPVVSVICVFIFTFVVERFKKKEFLDT